MLFLLWGMICGEVTREDYYGRPYQTFIGAHFVRYFFGPPRQIEVANDNAVQAA